MDKNYAGNILIALSIGLLIFFAGAKACGSYPVLAKWFGGECWFESDTSGEVDLMTAQQQYHEARTIAEQNFNVGEDKDDEIVKAAIYALAQSGSSEAISALKKIVLTHQSVEIRKAALYALAQCESGEKLTLFYGDLIDQGDVLAVRKAAVYALGQSGGNEAITILEALALSTHPVALRKAAIHALQNYDEEPAQQALYRILSKVSHSL